MEDASELSRLVLSFIEETVEDSEADASEFQQAKQSAERAVAHGTVETGFGLSACMLALEELLAVATCSDHGIQNRISEVIWFAKDAAEMFKDANDISGQIASLRALTRGHLARGADPDAPSSALKVAREAVDVCNAAKAEFAEAGVQLLVAEAHVAKAVATPYEDVLIDQVTCAAAAARGSEEFYKQQGDKRNQARALHCLAKALLRHTDEDEALDGERAADDAQELFNDIGDRESEVSVFLTGVSSRYETSGPESALMMASDAAEDWKQTGDRKKDVALALLLTAKFQLELNEHKEAITACTEAQALGEAVGDQRTVASALETKAAIHSGMKRYDEATQSIEEMAQVFQRMGKKNSQGRAYVLAASLLLTHLYDEVEADTKAESEGKAATAGLSTTDVHRRSGDAADFVRRASKLFDEIADEDGKKSVADLVQGIYNKAIQMYCKSKEPDQIYYVLEKDTPLEDSSKCIKEWKIPVPALKRSDGPEGSDGFVHIFDPYPPPGKV